jgi:hypothetical protein
MNMDKNIIKFSNNNLSFLMNILKDSVPSLTSDDVIDLYSKVRSVEMSINFTQVSNNILFSVKNIMNK